MFGSLSTLRSRAKPRASPGAPPQVAALLAALLVAGCGRAAQHTERDAQVVRPASCPERAQASAQLPNTAAELSTLGYWLSATPAAQLDQRLLDVDQLAAHDQALRHSDGEPRFVDLAHSPSSEELQQELSQRLSTWRERFRSGDYALDKGGDTRAPFEEAAGAQFTEARSLHIALAPIALRCTPLLDVVRSVHGDKRFDRNLCSQVRAQEPVELLGKLGDLPLVRSRYAVGFMPPTAELSPAVSGPVEQTIRAGRELELRRELTLLGHKLAAGAMLSAASPDTVYIASTREVAVSRTLSEDEAHAALRPLTRRSFLTEAFGHIGSPYGLGDEGGGRDCSRLVLDVLRSFGLHLPRTSVEQSTAGGYSVDIPPTASQVERLGLLDEAATRGIVLFHFPGHIAMYLGRDKSGVPRLLHSFAEYLRPCDGGGETLVEVGRVGVSDLTLGKGTSRRSFLERVTRLTVFGAPPGHGLLALASFRAPAAPAPQVPERCDDDGPVALFRSPREPHSAANLRIMAVSETEMRPASLWLIDPNGQLFAPPVQDLGVGPYTRWAEVATPIAGKWTALLADGTRVLACQRIRVQAALARGAVARLPDAAAWRKRNDWSARMEGLYAAFVEQLFGLPLEDTRSFSSLSELLRDPARNLLLNHLDEAEDTRVTLAPDCADLPYFLRAYFAFKLGLPFGFRPCSRGKANTPPRCGEPVTQATPVAALDDVAAFESFIRRVSSGVHSASGRTLPDDRESDLYPLPLTREALRPGSVFIDPYGHMIVVARWLPQGLSGQGMLLGADAQPDATVGRRRFWRGNFLFTPDTHDVGAGFKAFRPLPAPEASGKQASEVDLFEQQGSAQPSLEQYQGKLDAFYQRMDELIYPRPIAVSDRMTQLVDALEEQVRRRVEAIDIGEAYMRERRGIMAMPDGYAIFETEGAWEDFATPSRDMRLLIAMDAVQAFAAQVRAHPERFLASPAEVEAVPGKLSALLGQRHFEYTRSDGSKQQLALSDVLSRAAQLELAYNPNDCVEERWGAAPESDEHATCTRAAPAAQRRTMERYRPWFHTRIRPARP